MKSMTVAVEALAFAGCGDDTADPKDTQVDADIAVEVDAAEEVADVAEVDAAEVYVPPAEGRCPDR